MSKRILSVHAHPDDVEILAAGTLALLARMGHQITIVTMTPGDKGSMIHGAEEIAAIRRDEAEAAAKLIGAEYQCAEFSDLEIFVDHESRSRIVELLRVVRPDVVLTAPPVDYLCDHEATSVLVRDACFASSAPNYQTDSDPLPRIPHLYFMDAIGGADRDGRPVLPDFVVDISTTYQTKWNMLACHASQRDWLRSQHGMDNYMHTMERWSKICGARAGFPFGEGFRRYKGHPYPETPMLEELLGAELICRLNQ